MPVQEYVAEPAVEAPPAEAVAPEAPAAAPEAVSGLPESTPAGQGAEAEPDPVAENPTFTVKVNGEEFQVTMDEALAGYQRQQDYTRSKQALAAERKELSQAERLWNAFQDKPQETLAAIAATYGLTVAQVQQAQAQSGQVDPFADLLDEAPAPPADDPRLAAIEAFIEEQQVRDAQASVEAECQAVRTKYGSQIPSHELVKYAIDNQIGSLEAAFRALSFEGAQQQAIRLRKEKSKATLPPVAPGHGPQAGVLQPGSGNKFPTIEESFEIALAALEG